MMSSPLSTLRWWAGWIVFLHAAVVIVHGIAHAELRIQMSNFAMIFIVLVIGIGPLVGFILLRWGLDRKGAVVLAATMAGAFLFGLWNHFVVPGADHVAHLQDGSWKAPFQITAGLLLLTEGAGWTIGLGLLRARSLRVE